MGDLRLRLLGGLVVEGLRPVDVGSRKARTLLGALALPPRAPVPVDLLAEVLWDDHLPARPAEQVGVLVSRLRRVLGADRLLRHDAGYSLRADWVDVDELEDRVATAQRHLHAGEALEARLAATMALDLGRGPLLPEEEGEWVETPRAAVARTLSAAGLVAAEAALLAGDPLGAAAAAASVLDHDPYDEAALRALMRAHVGAGRPASALASYAEVRARLAEDLGVSPTSETEALHQALLGEEPVPPSPARVDQWDPLVQRARLALASTQFDEMQRDAERAVRRGGGPGALEVAGWAAYYKRDFPAALRWAEEAASRTDEDERRASCLALAGRVRHSSGDLAGAQVRLEEAAHSRVAGVRAMSEVWLGSLRVHQGRAEEALELTERGAIEAAAMRHPFVIPHAMCSRVHALGIQGRVADALAALEAWEVVLEELGPSGSRFRAVLDNYWGWVLASVGRTEEADERNREALAGAGQFTEPEHHALLDLAQAAVERDDPDEAAAWLARLEVPPDEAGAMAWHQRHRARLLEARIALLCDDPSRARELAEVVVADAHERGAARPARLAEAVAHLADAASGGLDPAAAAATLRGLDELAGLEAWRVTARLAAVVDDEDLWAAARRRAAALLARCGPQADATGAWIDAELDRLKRSR